MMNAREPKYTATGDIDLILAHPVFGEIPFTASPDDVMDYGRELHARAVAGEFGAIAAYIPPGMPA